MGNSAPMSLGLPIIPGDTLYPAKWPTLRITRSALFAFRSVVAVWSMAFVSAAAPAIEDRAGIEPNEPVVPDRGIARKLTPSVYHETASRSAVDLNLRGNRECDTFWIGQYWRGAKFQQTRAGYERQFAVPMGRVIGSGQYAIHGFWGGSVTPEASAAAIGPYLGPLGLGRINRKP